MLFLFAKHVYKSINSIWMERSNYFNKARLRKNRKESERERESGWWSKLKRVGELTEFGAGTVTAFESAEQAERLLRRLLQWDQVQNNAVAAAAARHQVEGGRPRGHVVVACQAHTQTLSSILAYTEWQSIKLISYFYLKGMDNLLNCYNQNYSIRLYYYLGRYFYLDAIQKREIQLIGIRFF